jgi:hypothetical protein
MKQVIGKDQANFNESRLKICSRKDDSGRKETFSSYGALQLETLHTCTNQIHYKILAMLQV